MNRVSVDAGGREEVPADLLERAVLETLAGEAVDGAEISLALVGDGAIQELNRTHLGRDRPTDVLAFALWEEGETVLGDVYIGADQAVRQAREEGVPLEEELVRLAVHGTLHVLGWDHPEAAPQRASSPMFRLQESLVTRILSAGAR
ncbi:MAG TPA: rRNA maturation RNase YbeY [Longimicrobiales bacterium]